MTVQLPLYQLPGVTLKSTFYDLFGTKAQDLDEAIRRERWERWKEIAAKSGKRGSGLVEVWTDTEGCHGPEFDHDCAHLDGDWCRLMGLPASVNPILSMRHGMPGMACMGAGYEPSTPQRAEPQGSEASEGASVEDSAP